jgi:diguanylate cyclase (GGDEF)-like protein
MTRRLQMATRACRILIRRVLTVIRRAQTAISSPPTAIRPRAIEARDLAALARDRAAAARDQAMAQLDTGMLEFMGRGDFSADRVRRAVRQRQRAAEYPVLGAEDRAMAAEDRDAAANDRQCAADERMRALADRELLAAELALAETDPLTGARARAAGLVDVDRELDRCRRTGGMLVVAYSDVVGLKHFNDTLGHAAGDALLRQVTALFKANLRPYDLIVRVGGDEFVCAISDMSEADVRLRFDAVSRALADHRDARGIRTGFATLGYGESAAELIARADAELIRPPRD